MPAPAVILKLFKYLKSLYKYSNLQYTLVERVLYISPTIFTTDVFGPVNVMDLSVCKLDKSINLSIMGWFIKKLSANSVDTDQTAP